MGLCPETRHSTKEANVTKADQTKVILIILVNNFILNCLQGNTADHSQSGQKLFKYNNCSLCRTPIQNNVIFPLLLFPFLDNIR